MTAAVLFLDPYDVPLRIAPMRKALKAIVKGKVEVVYYSEDKTIRSAEASFPMPSIVRVLKAFRRDKVRIKFSRLNIYARDYFCCQYCRAKPGTEGLTFDHVLPKSRGGKTDWFNIVTCCIPCNKAKRDRTPEEAGMRLHTQPTRPRYLPTVSVKIGKETPKEWRRYWNVDLAA